MAFSSRPPCECVVGMELDLSERSLLHGVGGWRDYTVPRLVDLIGFERCRGSPGVRASSSEAFTN